MEEHRIKKYIYIYIHMYIFEAFNVIGHGQWKEGCLHGKPAM